MLESLEPFIHYGYFTVPINSQYIKRNEEGKKVFKAPTKWQRFQTEFNEQESNVGAIVTGPLPEDFKHAEVIAIDCDSPIAYEIMMGLDPDCKAIMRSKGKMYKGTTDVMELQPATFLYKRTEADPATMNNGPLDIEIFNGGSARMVFLPTKNNLSKEPWDTLPTLTEMPETVRAFLHTLVKPAPVKSVATTTLVKQGHNVGMRLYPLVVRAVESATYIPQLFKIITPIVYRNKTYTKQGHLHPREISDRSDYIFKISTMLGTDISIDEELYTKAIRYVNRLFTNPMDNTRLNSEIIKPMVSGSAHYEGKQLWQYDKDWESLALMGVSKKGELLEYFYDDIVCKVFEVNHTHNTHKQHKLHAVKPHMGVTLIEQFGKGLFDKNIQNYTTSLYPHKPFGLVEGTHEYNIFKASPHLRVLNDPDSHKEEYKEPANFIKYMESLVPDEIDRVYLLRFLRTKLTTFKYSPVILYFVGVGGSGKGLFSSILEEIIGTGYISKDLGAAQLMEGTGYNAWMVNKYFVHFDELYKELSRYDAPKATEKLKRYSGSKTFAVRLMNTDPGTSAMLATLILTQNGSSLHIEPGDRRFHYVNTPNVLGEDMGELIAYDIEHNMSDIAYYLATEFTNLDNREYMRAPTNEHKEALMISNIPISARLVYFIKNKMFDELFTIAADANVSISELTEWRDKGRIKSDVLIAIHRGITGADIENPTKIFRELFKKTLVDQPNHPYSGSNILYCQAHGFEDYSSEFEINLEDIPVENVNL